MATRKIIDIEQNGEKVWPKGHAKATFMSDGRTVEDAINAGGSGGGGTITETEIAAMGFTKNTGDYSKPSGGIPEEDLAENVRSALRDAAAYKGTVIGVKANNSTKMPDAGIVDLGTVGTYSKPSTGIPKSDLNPSVQTSLGKADTAVQPADIKDEVYIADFTMELLKNGMNNGTNVECDVQALVSAMNANKVILVREGEDSAYKGVYVLNGYAEDLLYFSILDSSGNILWCDSSNYTDTHHIEFQSLHLQSWADKQDVLVSGNNIKTINGESILGSGNITVEGGGSGEGGSGIEPLILESGVHELMLEEMQPNKKYWLFLEIIDQDGTISIGSFQGFGGDGVFMAEYFAAIDIELMGVDDDYSGTITLELPNVDIRWANGTPPELGIGRYELSINCVNDTGYPYYSAVLTPFKEI